jgi:hypothetical protein
MTLTLQLHMLLQDLRERREEGWIQGLEKFDMT